MQNFVNVQMFCPNCGKLLNGARNQDAIVKIRCLRCGTAIVSKQKSPKHTMVDVYAPVGERAVSF